MSNIVKNTDNRHGTINQTTIIKKYSFDFKKWFGKTFQSKKYYANVKALSSVQLRRKINIQQSNHKYIPDIFLELDQIKESLRYITQPILFYKKNIDELNNIKFHFFNEVLDKLDFDKQEINIPSKLMKANTLEEVYKNINDLKGYFKNFKNNLPTAEEQQEFKNTLSEEQYKLFINNQTIYGRYERFIDDFEKSFNLLTKKFILLTEKAGQGKTNLVCDFVDKVMLKKDLLGVMFTGNEFNNLTRDQIEDVILKDIYGFDAQYINFDEFLNDINHICKQQNTTFTILIDGLNENTNIEQFSRELYVFVETILQKEYIRLIFTCRSEYFDERFQLFKEASFSDNMLMMENYMKRYQNYRDDFPVHLEDRLIKGYFDFFKIKNTVFTNVKKRLVKDFLLLRIFSEVYGGKINPNGSTEQVYNIYKDKLFKQYFEFKQKQISDKKLYSSTDFKILFDVILRYMIENQQYINIPFERLQNVNVDLLNYIIDEDVFFRRDLVKDEASIFANSEVLNFTFDEFRDFLVADFLVNNNIDIAEFLEKHSANDTIIEGVERYLFFKSRQESYREKLAFFEFYETYDALFLKNIFSVDDKDITKSDILKIKELFLINNNYSSRIIDFLMYRHFTQEYTNLNICHLFEIISSLTDEQYDQLVSSKFKIEYEHYSRRQRGDFLELLKELEEILENRNFDTAYQLHNIFEFMFLLLGVEDENRYDEPPYELIELLEKYIEKYPSHAKLVLIKYQNIQLQKIQVGIWEMLNFYVEKKIDFDGEFCQKIFYELILPNLEISKHLRLSFLEKCYKHNNDLFREEQKEYFQILEQEREKQWQYFQDIKDGKIDLSTLYMELDI